MQLPPPRFSFEESPTNIPLAAGFVVAALEALNPQRILAQILGPEIMDVFADQGLAGKVADRRPDVAAMTLYVWNVERSLFLASNIKRRLPSTIILVGGPEVTPDNKWVLEHPAVDAGVFGEGESRIGPVLEALREHQRPLGIPGTFFKDSGGVHVNEELARPWNLESCPYPYLDGRIGPSRDGTLFLETVRGCPFRCRYCYYHKAFHGVRYHPSASVEEVLDLAYARDSGIKEIYLMDPTFNARPGFRNLLVSVTRRRDQKDLRLHAELRSDTLTRDDVRLLKEAGLVTAEVGLQSVNPAALRAAGRDVDPDKVSRGVTWLKEADIDVTTGIILGLPGDSPEGFSGTLEWLKRTSAYSVVHPFVLSVLPGTDFRARATDLGLRYDPRPPYYVRSTETFPEAELRPALLRCEHVFDMELDYISPPSLVDAGPGLFTTLDEADYVNKWIVNPEHAQWQSVLSGVIQKATDPFIIWFRGRYREPAMLTMLQEFSEANPHAVLHVVLDFGDLPPLLFFDRAIERAAHPGLFLNRSYQPLYLEGEVVSINFTIVLPDPGQPEERERMASDYLSKASVVWEIDWPDEEEIEDTEIPLLVSRPLLTVADTYEGILKALNRVHGDCSEQVLFRDDQLQQAWNSLARNLDPATRLPEKILVT
ncbi:MAG: B12-binding domain-containing radical SAM protein [Desulfomonilaceae bacterium]